MINFNPRLPINDSLTPEQIAAKAENRNAETRELTEKAYLVAGVPPSAAKRSADHASIMRQTAEAEKARKDAGTWLKAKDAAQFEHWEDDDD